MLAQAYLNELMSELGKLPRWGGGVSHGDAAIQQQLSAADAADNYFVYAVGSLLMARALDAFSMRKCHGTMSCAEASFAERRTTFRAAAKAKAAAAAAAWAAAGQAAGGVVQRKDESSPP